MPSAEMSSHLWAENALFPLLTHEPFFKFTLKLLVPNENVVYAFLTFLVLTFLKYN